MAANGRLPASDLATLPGGHRVRRDLAAQTLALLARFAVVFGKALGITDSYRPYSVQERIFRQRYTTTYLPGRPSKVWNGRRWWQKRGTAMAAVPGTSNHGLGTAIDFASRVNVQGSAEHRWMVANAPTFGWAWPRWWAENAGEWWHFEAYPVPASNYAHLGGGTVPSVPDLTSPDPLTPEDDMAGIVDDPKVQAKFTELVNDAVKGAVMQLLHEAGARSTPVGRNADTNLRAYLRVLTHWFWHLLAGRVDPNARQTSDAIRAVVGAGGSADVDEQALAAALAGALAPQLATRLVAELPPTGLTQTQIEAALRKVLGSLDE